MTTSIAKNSFCRSICFFFCQPVQKLTRKMIKVASNWNPQEPKTTLSFDDPEWKTDFQNWESWKRTKIWNRSPFDQAFLSEMNKIKQLILDASESEEEKKGYREFFKKSLISLVQDLHQNYGMINGELVENHTPLYFSSKGLKINDGEKEPQKQREVLFILTAQTFGFEIAEAVSKRYCWEQKNCFIFEDIKNIFSFTTAYVLPERMEDLYREIVRDETLKKVAKKLSHWKKKQETIENEWPTFIRDCYQEAENQELPLIENEKEEFAKSMVSFFQKEKFFLCSKQIPRKIRKKIASYQNFSEIPIFERRYLYQAFCGIRKKDHFLPFSHFFFGTVTKDFRGLGRFDSILHDRKMAQDHMNRLGKACMPEFQDSLIMEYLCKMEIYLELKEGISLLIPKKEGKEELISCISQIDNKKDGVMAHLLAEPFPSSSKQETLIARLIFRGTQWDPSVLGSIESVKRDVDVTGVGRISYEKRKTDLLRMVEHFLEKSPLERPVDFLLGGHSLGGCDGERFLQDLLEKYNKEYVKEPNDKSKNPWLKLQSIRLENFNSPMPNETVSKRFQNEMKKLEKSESPLHISICLHLLKNARIHDPAQNIGDAHVGCGLKDSNQFSRSATLSQISARNFDLDTLHNTLVFPEGQKAQIEKIDEKTDSKKLEKIFSGKTHWKINGATTKKQKVFKAVRWLTGMIVKPFLYITFLALEALVNLWAILVRTFHPHREFFNRPGKVRLVLHRLGMDVDNKIVIDPSHWY